MRLSTGLEIKWLISCSSVQEQLSAESAKRNITGCQRSLSVRSNLRSQSTCGRRSGITIRVWRLSGCRTIRISTAESKCRGTGSARHREFDGSAAHYFFQSCPHSVAPCSPTPSLCSAAGARLMQRRLDRDFWSRAGFRLRLWANLKVLGAASSASETAHL